MELWDRCASECAGPRDLIHFNNAGSAKPPQAVLDAQVQYLTREVEVGGYEAVFEQNAALERPYSALATLLNCSPDEIAVLTSSTAAWQQVFGGFQWQPQDRILTSVVEYGSNFLAYLQVRDRFQVSIEVIPEDDQGDIDIPALEKLISSGTRKPALIAITHIPSGSGRVYTRAAEVGAIARREGIPYILDATQTIGQMPLDVQAIGCDYLCSTGRKFLRGPRGIGFLYASRQAMSKTAPAFVDVHGATWTGPHTYELDASARRYEQYEISFAAKAGLGVAVEYALGIGIERIWQRVQELAAVLRKQLAATPGVTLHDRGRLLCGIVSFTLAGQNPFEVQNVLRQKRILVSVSPASYTQIDYSQRGLTETIRASLHYYNTHQEIEQLVAALHELHR